MAMLMNAAALGNTHLDGQAAGGSDERREGGAHEVKRLVSI